MLYCGNARLTLEFLRKMGKAADFREGKSAAPFLQLSGFRCRSRLAEGKFGALFHRAEFLAPCQEQFLEEPQKEHVKPKQMQPHEKFCFHKRSSCSSRKTGLFGRETGSRNHYSTNFPFVNPTPSPFLRKLKRLFDFS